MKERKYDIMVIVLGCLMCLFCSPKGISWGGDNYVYVMLGKALRTFSYREFWNVTNPIHAQYLPGYPVLIALTSTNIMVQRILATAYYAIGLWFLSLWLKEPTEKRLIILILTAFTPVMVKYGGMEYSEMPFFAFCMISLYLIPKFKAFIPTALFAFLIRPVGIALFVTAFFQYKGWKRITVGIIGVCCAVLTLILRTEGSVLNPYNTSLGTTTILDVLARIPANIMAYIKIIAEQL